jgi:hypothetical protein
MMFIGISGNSQIISLPEKSMFLIAQVVFRYEIEGFLCLGPVVLEKTPTGSFCVCSAKMER